MEKDAIKAILKNPLFWVAISLLGCGVVLSFLDKTGGGIATYGAGIFCLVFVFIDKFESFKGLGIQGKLREKINEADEVIQRLRGISILVTETLFTLMARMGRWDSSLSRRQIHGLMKRFENELRMNGVSSQDIDVAKQEWHRVVIFDLAYKPLLKKIHQKLSEKTLEKDNEVNSYPQPIAASDPVHRRLLEERGKMYDYLGIVAGNWDLNKVQSLNSSAVESLVNDCPFFLEQEKSSMLSDLRPELDDLDHYIRTHEFRRLEKWFEEMG